MAMNIYKSGQGYWTRLLSGIGFGVLILAFVAWIYREMEVLKGYESITDVVIWIQLGLALVLISVLGLLLYRWVAVKPRTCDFMIATEGEMKKVNWPTKREVKGSTWIVIAFVVILVGILFSADLLFSSIFKFFNILEEAKPK